MRYGPVREYGGPLGAVLAVLPDLALSGVRMLTNAAFTAGYAAADIFVYVSDKSLDIIQTTIEGVVRANLSFAKAINLIFRNVGNEFRVNFIKGLFALGNSHFYILKEVAKLGLTYLAIAFADFMILWGGRKLTLDEKKEARKVFGTSIDLERIRITEGSIPAHIAAWLSGQSAAFTTMYVINLPPGRKFGRKDPWLIHELTHVWQGIVRGPVYMVESSHEQITEGREAAYHVELLSILSARNLLGLETEEQARIVEWYYKCAFKGETIRNHVRALIPCRELKRLAGAVYRAPLRRGEVVRYFSDIPLVVGRRIPRAIS